MTQAPFPYFGGKASVADIVWVHSARARKGVDVSDVSNIVREYLVAHGYDGLVSSSKRFTARYHYVPRKEK